jgi:hypothetical protein
MQIEFRRDISWKTTTWKTAKEMGYTINMNLREVGCEVEMAQDRHQRRYLEFGFRYFTVI